MFNFGLIQNLSRLFFLSIGVSLLLILSVPTAAAVNSPTLTVLDMGEMSQIAGGTYCYEIDSPGVSYSGTCRHGRYCQSHVACGTNPSTIILPNEACVITINEGYHHCHCRASSPGWLVYNCQRCKSFKCAAEFLYKGGKRSLCNKYTACGG